MHMSLVKSQQLSGLAQVKPSQDICSEKVFFNNVFANGSVLSRRGHFLRIFYRLYAYKCNFPEIIVIFP